MTKLTVDQMWEQMLMGSYPRLHGMRKMWGALPSPPRCNAPFRGPGGVMMRVIARCSISSSRICGSYGPTPRRGWGLPGGG
jgi:hypothetical protein